MKKKRYKFLHISLLSSAKQEREVTMFRVVWGTWATTANFSYFHLELNAVIAYLEPLPYWTDLDNCEFRW